MLRIFLAAIFNEKRACLHQTHDSQDEDIPMMTMMKREALEGKEKDSTTEEEKMEQTDPALEASRACQE